MITSIDEADARMKKAYEDLKSAFMELTEKERKDLKERRNKFEKELKNELANQMDELTARIKSELKK